jgi:2-amino-4-hydroxy-6-hydroxymethyldihydropteridine diphosphokinase
MTVAYLGLGSNLGERLSYLRAAVAALAKDNVVTVVACSPVFETAAVAVDPQPDYLNAALRIHTTLTCQALLAHCLAVERDLGRTRPAHQVRAARTIDVDVLLFGNDVVDQPGLRVPHPELLVRAFVRVPLSAVAEPGLRHPVTGILLDVFTDLASGVMRTPDVI